MVLTGCSTNIGGILVSENPDYVKILTKDELTLIKRIIVAKSTKPVSGKLSPAKETTPTSAQFFAKHLYLPVKDSIFIKKYTFSTSFCFVRSWQEKTSEDILINEGERIIIKEAQAPFEEFRINNTNAGKLYRLCSPWDSEEEEKKATY